MANIRAVKVQIGSIEIDTTEAQDGLRVAFAVARDKSRDPDSAELVLYNLASSTRSNLDGRERLLCRIEAGYQDEGISQIFFGYLHDVVHVKAGVDWLTKISIEDDAKKKRAKVARINKTFPKNSSIGEVLRTMVKATGIESGNLGQFAASARLRGSPLLPRAWHASGESLEELNAFARSTGWEFSIKEGAFQFLEIGKPLLGTGPLISKETGMVGAPSLDDKGNVTAMSLLLPDLRPGQGFTLVSEVAPNANGAYLVTATEHVGDTHGQDWYVKIDGQPLVPGFVPAPGIVIN